MALYEGGEARPRHGDIIEGFQLVSEQSDSQQATVQAGCASKSSVPQRETYPLARRGATF